ncbi:MAG: hypothetical protein ABEK42_12235, partial [Thiohalorhabdaceae bacterium]
GQLRQLLAERVSYPNRPEGYPKPLWTLTDVITQACQANAFAMETRLWQGLAERGTDMTDARLREHVLFNPHCFAERSGDLPQLV